MTTVWRRLMSGSTHKTVYMPEFKRLYIAVPSIHEQRKITGILATCDEVIEKLGALVAAKRQQQKALMQQLLRAEKRLPGFRNEWGTLSFSDVFERVTRRNASRCQNNLTISGSLGLISQGDYFGKRIAATDASRYFLLRRGELAYNKSYSDGYPLGAIKMLERYDEGVVSTLYICFGIKPTTADTQFVRHYFESAEFNRELYAIAQEGARNHGLLNVAPHDFFNTRLRFPEIEEQRAVALVLGRAEVIVRLLKSKIAALKQQRKALRQKLLTGGTRVEA